MYKKAYILLLCIGMVMFVSAVPPQIQFNTNGYVIEYPVYNFVKLNQDFNYTFHVFNETNGLLTTDVSCKFHLYEENGVKIDIPDPVQENGGYKVFIDGGNFTERGAGGYIVHCNNSGRGGFVSGEYQVNGYGQELTEGVSFTFNMSMIFLMILFLLAMIGIFTVEHYAGRFALYWVAHVLFIVGTFSVWQFNYGYSTNFSAIFGVFKILFYVSTIALFPMVILSLAWIFYTHTVTDEMKRMMEDGMDAEEAFGRSTSKKGLKW